MKTTILEIRKWALIGVVILSSCSQKPENILSEISKSNQEFVNLYNNGDTQSLAAHYTEDAMLLPPNTAVIKGRAAAASYWSSGKKWGFDKIQMEATTAQAYGDVAIEEGTYTIFAADAKEMDKGKFMITWKNVEGKWLQHRNIWSSDLPVPQPRAALNDTVWMVAHHVIANKTSQFEEFNFKYLHPAAFAMNPSACNKIRLVKSLNPNKDGTITYFYIMDPVVKNLDYNILNTLATKYSDEESKKHFAMFNDCLKKQPEAIATVQTAW
jgi:ketosteroid isomerase-like protein